jgi:arginyl-tRNA synthetase
MSIQSYDPIKKFLSEIKSSLALVLQDLGVDQKPTIEQPPEELGDFAFPCFNLAPLLKKSPGDIAAELNNKLPEISGITCENKGPYLNFKIDNISLAQGVLGTIFELVDEYGSHPKQNLKIILEHTSANPTDKLHVGRARNPIIGDTLGRILRSAGFEVETQYYVDDMGKQSARKILEARHTGEWDITRFKTGYQWATSATTTDSEYYDPQIAKELDDIMDGLERGNPEDLKEADEICNNIMGGIIVPSLDKINVKIDNYVNESQFMLDNSVKEVIENFKSSEFFGIEDDAYYIDLTQFGVKSDKDKFFFVRADGKSLYATRDVAYHLWKFQNCDSAINILGEDHKLETEYVRVGLELMGEKNAPENIFYAFVNLPEGRMSTRAGKVVYLDDLLDEAVKLAISEVKKRRDDLPEDKINEIAEIVGLGAIRYNIIRVQAEKKIVFKWEDALNFEGDSAPFIQYAHARACSILRKSGHQSDDYIPTEIQFELIIDPSEISLVRTLGKFPEIVEKCANQRQCHPIASYAHEVAAAFNQFYRDCPVLQAKSKDLLEARLALVAATRVVLKNALDLLGIIAPKSM